MSSERLLFTSESVTAGHPDKLCDAISDAILDACLAQDPNARVACETLVKGTENNSKIVLAGEITCAQPEIDYATVARNAAKSIGYTDQAFGIDHAGICLGVQALRDRVLLLKQLPRLGVMVRRAARPR